MRPRRTLPTLLCLAALALPAHAGVVYRMQSQDTKKPQTSEMKVEGLRLRMDQVAGKEQTTMIFDGNLEEMYMVDHKKKSYTVMNEETMKQLADQMGQVMKQLDEALANVPAAQREMMEKMMKQRLGAAGGEPVPAEIKSLGRSEEVAGIDCSWKEISRGGTPDFRGCFADPGDVPGGDQVQRANEKMKEFVSSLLDAMSSAGTFGQMVTSMSQSMLSNMAMVGGFPLISEIYMRGKLVDSTRFVEARETSVAASEFQPPAGYKRQELAPARGGR